MRTTADEHLDKARGDIQSAIENLSEIVVRKAWGYDEYKQEFEEKILSVYMKLIELSRELK